MRSTAARKPIVDAVAAICAVAVVGLRGSRGCASADVDGAAGARPVTMLDDEVAAGREDLRPNTRFP